LSDAAPVHAATTKTVAAKSQRESRILPRIPMLKRIGGEKFLPSAQRYPMSAMGPTAWREDLTHSGAANAVAARFACGRRTRPGRWRAGWTDHPNSTPAEKVASGETTGGMIRPPRRSLAWEIVRPRSRGPLGDGKDRGRFGALWDFYISPKWTALKVGHLSATCGRTSVAFQRAFLKIKPV